MRKLHNKTKSVRRQKGEKADILDLQFNNLKLLISKNDVPFCMRTTLNFYEQVNFTAVATPQLYVYRGNSPWDPNQTGIGSTATSLATYAVFYNSLFTRGSRIEVIINNTTTQNLQFCIVPTYTPTTVTTYDTAVLMPFSKRITVSGSTRGGDSYKTIRHELSTLKFMSRTYNDDFISSFTSNPGAQFYWSIVFQSADQVTALTLNLQTRVYYDVSMFDRRFS